MSYTIDDSELQQFQADLVTAVDRITPEVERITERGALNIRRDARQAIRGQITGTYLPHYPNAITYEMNSELGAVEAEIGPEVDRLQGGMGPGVEFGSAHTAPLPHLLPAHENEESAFLREIGRATDRILR